MSELTKAGWAALEAIMRAAESAPTADDVIAGVQEILAGMDPDERVNFTHDLMDGYCRHCGWPEPKGSFCQCTNDE